MVPVWHNCGDHRLSWGGAVWQRVTFGLWRKVRNLEVHEDSVKIFYASYGYTYAADYGFRLGLLFRLSSLWVGAHYSEYNRRWCINLLPCVTVWVTLKGGRVPSVH